MPVGSGFYSLKKTTNLKMIKLITINEVVNFGLRITGLDYLRIKNQFILSKLSSPQEQPRGKVHYKSDD